jgi:hypothetical protein
MPAALIAGVLAMLIAVAPSHAQEKPHLAIAFAVSNDPPPPTPGTIGGDSTTIAAGPSANAGPAIRSIGVLSDGQTRDLLRNGFPARLHFRIELWHEGGVFNSHDGTREWDVIVRYDPVQKRFRAARLHNDSVTVMGNFADFGALSAAVEAPYVVPLPPPHRGGRFYYNAVLDIEMLSLNDLDEVERWLRGELGPAVRGKRNPGGVLGRGLRTLFVRLLGAERRHYEARSKAFRNG